MPYRDPEQLAQYQREYKRMQRDGACQTPGQTLVPLPFRLKTAADLVPLCRKAPSLRHFEPHGLLEVWDGEDWTPVRAVTATRRRAGDPDHRLFSIQSRAGVVEVTAHHRMLDAERDDVRGDALEEGDRLADAADLGWVLPEVLARGPNPDCRGEV